MATDVTKKRLDATTALLQSITNLLVEARDALDSSTTVCPSCHGRKRNDDRQYHARQEINSAISKLDRASRLLQPGKKALDHEKS